LAFVVSHPPAEIEIADVQGVRGTRRGNVWMTKQFSKPTLVMNIKREWFAAILAQPPRKKVEYRSLSGYWLGRLEKVGASPFRIRLLNGMNPPVPEATIQVTKVIKNRRTREIELHLGKVIEVKHWDRRKETPTR
jgi:hypothetical protein